MDSEGERMSEKKDHQPGPAEPASPSRRGVLLTLGIALNAIAAALFAAPLLGYLLSAARLKRMRESTSWVALGRLDVFPEGETRLAIFRNPFTRPWDGATGDIPCWVRRTVAEQFQVFAINCAHLGCPVRWFPQSGLFLCPCHGGAYYSDGARASGPPERGLFEYKYKVEEGQLWIMAGMMPTLGQRESSLAGTKPCA